MPTYIVTSPDGRKFQVSGPEGSTPEQALQQVQAQLNNPPQPQQNGELPSEKYLRETGQSIPQVSSNVPLQAAREGLRTLGSAGRDIAQGALSLPATLLDAPELLYNAGAQLVGSDSRAPTIFTNAVRALDNPAIAPRTPMERVVSGVDQAVSGAATGVGVGQSLANSANAATANVGQQLAARPGMQALSAATGATSAGIVKEKGGGPGAQLLAGILGSIAPSLLESGSQALVRRTFRGGEEGQQKMQQNIAAFEDAGTTPTVGQATQGRVAQASESLLAKTPGSAGRMTSKAEQQGQQIGQGIEDLASSLSPKSSGEQAGRAIVKGVSGEGGFIDTFKAKQAELYDKLDEFIPANQRVNVENTKQALADLNAEIPGAPSVSKFFQNSKIKGIEGAVKSDTEGMSSIAANPELADAFKGKKVSPEDAALLQEFLADGKLPYEALKKLRTLVGTELSDWGIASDVPRSKWKALYGALSADLEAASNEAGPDAQNAWNRANNYTRAGMGRIDMLQSVVDKNGGPERVFQAATSGTKEGATTLRAVMQSLPQDARKTLSATVLRRLGLAKAGVQNELGDRFSTESFLTNWSSLSPEAKSVLFDRYGEGFRQNLDQISKVAANLRSGSKVFVNPSGTSTAAAQAGTVGALVMSVLTGRLETTAAITGGIGAANMSARLMTNPKFVNWLATSTNAPASAAPAAINSLAQQGRKSGDQDLVNAAAILKQQIASNKGNQRQQN